MSEKKEGKKPGLMKRLFSSRKLSVNADVVAEVEAEDEKNDKKNKMHRMHSVDGTSGKNQNGDDSIHKDIKVVKKQHSEGGKGSGKGKSSSRGSSRTSASASASAKPKGKARKKKKGSRQKGEVTVDVDVSVPIAWPVTPEIVLAYHKKKSFLNQNEEWLVVELNEYECLVENMDIIKIIAKHSKFFEVEPDELWDEFFEFMEDVPTYDEIVNYDVWQEFRDEKYPY